METTKIKLHQALIVLVVLGALLVGAKIITEIKEYRFIGGGVSATNTISISGEGEVFAPPDIARVSFSVREEAKKVADAQAKTSAKVKAALVAVRNLGVKDKDIKQASYGSYPKYEYTDIPGVCPNTYSYCPPRQGKQVISGYEVSQTVTLTLRDLDKASGIVDALAQVGVTETRGPDFGIDNEDILKATARKQAIDKARTKAETLARDLGVSLVRIVSFSEGGGEYPSYRGLTLGMFSKDSATEALPELPKGDEKITSQVTVTYEIR